MEMKHAPYHMKYDIINGVWGVMQLFTTDQFVLPLPSSHRFPVTKYRLLREAVASADWALPHQFVTAEAVTKPALYLVHDSCYVDRMYAGAMSEFEMRRIGFPWSVEMCERTSRAVGATLAAAEFALQHGVAVSLAGGTHHACRAHGEGYCVFNDVAVAAMWLKQQQRIRNALVVDLDVHQGNGTADIMQAHEWCYTFSMHGAKNYPYHKIPSRCDIGLADHTGDDEYLSTLMTALDFVMHAAHPDIVFYVSGADAYVGDRLGRLSLSKAGLLQRDQLVAASVQHHGVPCVVTMAGGYGYDVMDTVAIHTATVHTFVELSQRL
jgi:acetoin utilization deacetylase AcuC-like enzyme